MKTVKKNAMKKEYDFSKGVRGKYAKRYAAGTNIVKVDADLTAVFPDSQSVNDALRAMAKVIDSRNRWKSPRKSTAPKR